MVRKPYRRGVWLTGLAAAQWREIDGEAALRGVNPLRLPPHRFYNFLYAYFTRGMDEEKREAFDLQINKPLPWEKVTETVAPFTPEEEAAGFDALYAQVNGGVI